MKTAFLTLAVSAVALIGFSPEATAGPRISFPSGFGQMPFVPPVPGFFGHRSVSPTYHGGHGSHTYQGGHGSHTYHGGHGVRGPGYGYSSSGQCSTPYVVQTCEVSRQRHCMNAVDSYGRPYPVYVTVVTYRDTYSNGSCRTYTRTFR